MSAPRFYYPAKLAAGSIAALPEMSAHHAARVLRMQTGDALILFNGDGHDYGGTILRMSKNEVVAKIDNVMPAERESPLSVVLVQAISSGERMDFTLQKAVELGVTAIQPIASARSVVKLTGERAEKRREHWQNIVISACEQCGRAVVPQVTPILPLSDWLGQYHDDAIRLLLSPTAEETLHTLKTPNVPVCLLIGSEGGFTPQEQQTALANGFQSIRLGARVLRTETAALAALSAMQTLWGDF